MRDNERDQQRPDMNVDREQSTGATPAGMTGQSTGTASIGVADAVTTVAGTASVLIVDDEDVLLHLIAALVEDLGCRALTVPDGLQALRVLADEAVVPSLVICDVMMPRLSGLALAQMIRQDMRWRNVPIILMSAAGRPRVEIAADYFLEKPFDLDELASLIEQYTERTPCA